MLNEVTSLFDYFNKADKDKHYQNAAVMAYRYNYRTTITFKKAKKWIDDWAKDTIETNQYEPTCDTMVKFLNRFIRKINTESERRKKYLAAQKATKERLNDCNNNPPLAVEGAAPRYPTRMIWNQSHH